MQDDEIITLLRLFTSLGFDKIRLTGGEPTIRAQVVNPGARDGCLHPVCVFTMTTMGFCWETGCTFKGSRTAKGVYQPGHTRPDRFKSLTRWGKFEDVWAGIQAAESVGLTPLKLNMVVVRGHNLDDVVSMANLTYEHNWQVRFIEMMPFAGQTEFQTNLVVSDAEILELVSSKLDQPELLNHGMLDGEARLYRLPGAKGTLGFISSVTNPFCAGCTRARLTSDGKIRLCLLKEKEVDLLTPLRSGATRADLRP